MAFIGKPIPWPDGFLSTDRSAVGRILIQEQVRSEFVVIAGVGRKDLAQMCLAEDDDVIKAFPTDRSDQPLRMPILPG